MRTIPHTLELVGHKQATIYLHIAAIILLLDMIQTELGIGVISLRAVDGLQLALLLLPWGCRF